MIFIRLPLMLAFVALLAACSDNQKAAENKQEAVQKKSGFLVEFEAELAKQEAIEKALTPEERFAKLQKDAEDGNAQAQFNLGLMYAKGKGVLKDTAKAVEWYQKAAAQGDAQAQFNLGQMYDPKKSSYPISKANNLA